jgi:hypothetical protein
VWRSLLDEMLPNCVVVPRSKLIHILITGFACRKCAMQPSATRFTFAATQHNAMVARGCHLWKEKQEKAFDDNDRLHAVRVPRKAFTSLCLKSGPKSNEEGVMCCRGEFFNVHAMADRIRLPALRLT